MTNQTQKIILTGGPGCGKSSLILSLEQRGEYCLREAAEDIIKYQAALGNNEPWTNPDFQRWIFDLQLQREKALPKGLKRAFLDRGSPDGLAYFKQNKAEPFKEIIEESKKCNYFNKVFLIENLGHCQKNDVRRENLNESLILEGLLKETYEELGYKVIQIPPAPLKERADYLLNELGRYKK